MKSQKRVFGFMVAIAASATAIVLFSTCQSGSDSKSPSRGSSDATALSGTWSSGCQPDIGKKGYNFLDNRSFDGAIFMTNFTSFSDKDCKTKIMTQTQTGSFAIGPSTSGQSSYPLDLTIGTIIITLHTDSLTQSYNSKKFCGGGWETGQEKAITKEMCVPAGTASTEPDIIYEQFEIKGTTLFFGIKDGEHDGKTAEKRPEIIDQTRGYAKI